MKTTFEIPLVRATNVNLKGYGNLVDNFDNCQIQITQWPKQGWREIDPGTGDEGGITEGSFNVWWDKNILYGKNEAVPHKNINNYGSKTKSLSRKKKYIDNLMRKKTNFANFQI